ncbi:hypothetical protein [Methylomonas sp. MgM2]
METISNKLPTVAIYSKESPKAACSAIRLFDPISACNWNIIWKKRDDCAGTNFDTNNIEKVDLIIIQRDFPCRKTANILSYLTSLRIPILYDVDDYIIDNQIKHQRYFYFKTVKPYIQWIIQESDIITVSTSELKEKIETHTNKPIIVNRNLINHELLYVPPRQRTGTVNILVSGTPSHKHDWRIIIEPINEILKKYKDGVNITFLGTPPKFFLNNPLITKVNFERNYVDYAAQLRNLNADFALTPLEDTAFNRCKSNIKWLEYSSAGIPGIYSNLPPYNSCVKHNDTGLLVDNDPEAWFCCIEELIVSPEKTSAIARNAQNQVLENYSIKSAGADYSAVFLDMIKQKRTSGAQFSPPVRRIFSDTANIIMDKLCILYGILTE